MKEAAAAERLEGTRYASAESGVVRAAKPLGGLCEEAAYEREAARVERACVRARMLLGVHAQAVLGAPWPRLEPFAYGGVMVVGHEDGTPKGASSAFVVAGAHPPEGAVHAEALACELGWVDRRGSVAVADYRKLYPYARMGLLVAFVCQTTRARYYVVRDRERLSAADTVRRFRGRLASVHGGA